MSFSFGNIELEQYIAVTPLDIEAGRLGIALTIFISVEIFSLNQLTDFPAKIDIKTVLLFSNFNISFFISFNC